MQKCDVCKKDTDRLILLKGKNVCKECFAESGKEELDAGNIVFDTCI